MGMIDNKLTGIVKATNKKQTGLLLIYKDSEDELIESWFNLIGDNDEIMKLITLNLRRKEIELTISNIEKRTFSYLRIIESSNNLGKKSNNLCINVEDARKYRAMSVSYSKDAWIADKIEKEEVLTMAQSIFIYIWGE